MKLQGQDFIGAWQIQKELVKLCPKDETIKAFSQFLPAEAEEQRVEQQAAANEASEYESEDDEDEKDDDDDEEENKEEQKDTQEVDADGNPINKEDEAAEEVDADGNPIAKKDGDESEYESENYDDEGKYKWGDEGEDWEFYDQEDKDAYEQGTNKMFEPMNPDAVPTDFNPMVDMKTGAHHSVIVA